MQAWGLTELQHGNSLGAAKLIQRSVELDPSLAAVLRWQQVQAAVSDAQQIVELRKQGRTLLQDAHEAMTGDAEACGAALWAAGQQAGANEACT